MTVGELFVKMALDQSQYNRDLDEMVATTKKKAAGLGGIFKGAFSFALAMGMKSGLSSLGGMISDFVKTAADTEVLGVAMNSVAKASGYATSVLKEHRKEVMELGIAEQEASKILTRFMQAQLDTADAAKLARVAQDAAVIANMNSSQAAEQMTEAIAKQRPELLSAFGMTKNMNGIYSDYAQTIGKAGSELSDFEKKQAMLNYILAEGEKIAGTYESSMNAVGKQIGSLPRYWDTLKNAIATPLALPALSVVIKAITNGLKNAIAWAEANAQTLQQWGQVAANIASTIISAFQYVAKVFADNWTFIKLAGTALVTYAIATKVATGATALFQLISMALKGTLTTSVPILSALSTAVGTYRVQMALAPAATNLFSLALYKVQAAAYAAWTALGPVGWAIILISALVSGGIHLWGKYKESLMKTPKIPQAGDLSNKLKDLNDTTKKATKGFDKQKEALKKLRKEASKTLTSMDELHKIEKAMAAADGGLEAPPFSLEDFGLGDLDIPDDMFGIGDAFEDLMEKASIKGFFEWLWDSWSEWVQSWEWLDKVEDAVVEFFTQTIPDIWNSLIQWFKDCWESIKESWNSFWEWVSNGWDDLKQSVQDIWNSLIQWFKDCWESIKESWNSFWEWVSNGWDDLKQSVQDIWNSLIQWFKDCWESIKESWNSFWEWVSNGWEGLKQSIKDIWNRVIQWFKDCWESVKESWSSFWEWVSNGWDDLKQSIEDIWDGTIQWFKDCWDGVKGTWNKFTEWVRGWSLWKTIEDKIAWLKDVFNFQWKLPKIKMPKFSVSWDTSGVWGSIGKFLGLPGKPNLKVTWLAKGGIVGNATLIGAGEAGREAVLPLDRNTGWADIVAEKLMSSLGSFTGGMNEDPIIVQVIIGGDMILEEIIDASKRRNARAGKTVIQLGV